MLVEVNFVQLGQDIQPGPGLHMFPGFDSTCQLSVSMIISTYQLITYLYQVHCDNEDQVRADIRQFIGLYGSEHTLSGRVIARVLHGIPSPCFPAEVWGRARRFWRAQLHVDFNVVRRLATQEMVNMR